MEQARTWGSLVAVEVSGDDLARRRERRIVVGVDGSFGASEALRWAAKQACERDLALDVVAVWEDLATNGPTGDSQLDVARERLNRALESLCRDHPVPDEVTTAPLQGPPGERLVERARGAESLVLGTTGISSPEIPGGISVYVLRHSTVPVTFVPPHPVGHDGG